MATETKTDDLAYEIDKGHPGYDLAMHVQTLDSLIDGQPNDGGLGSALHPVRTALAKSLRALINVGVVIETGDWDTSDDGEDARDQVAALLGGGE
jgi:biotin operon repressor